MDVRGGNEIITTIWGQIQRRRRTEAGPGNPAGNSAPTDRQTDGRTITHWHTFRGAGCKGRDGHLGIVIARRVACVSVWTAAVCTVRRRDVTDPLRGRRVTSPIHRPRLFPRPPRLNCLEAGGSHTSGAVSVFVPAETRVSLSGFGTFCLYTQDHRCGPRLKMAVHCTQSELKIARFFYFWMVAIFFNTDWSS